MVETFNNESKQIDDATQFRINRTDEVKNYFIKLLKNK